MEQRTIAKLSARLVPFLIVCYFVAYLDRVNVSFAALTMNEDQGLTASAFGFGAGIFFLAYFLFEVPSNLFLERVVAGFAAPYAVGHIKDVTGSYTGGLLSLSAAGFVAMIIVLMLHHGRALECIPAASPAT